MKKSKLYLLNKKNKFVVNEKKYLLDILNPTSKNTKFYEAPPPGKITNLQIGRIILQVHQIINLVNSLDIGLKIKFFRYWL